MDRLLIALFCALLVLPTACHLAGLDLKGGEEDEKRKAADFPKLTLTREGVRAFPRGFDAWYMDHFGLRRSLIRLHSVVSFLGLRSTPSPKVIIGKDGWLFYNSAAGDDGTDSVADYRGTRPLTPAQLETWRWEFQDLHDWCAAHGKRYYLVLIPSKEALYPEHLPGWMTRAGDRTALEQMHDYLCAKARFAWTNVTSALIEGARRDRVFLLTDTHWTRYGAWCGYRAFMPMITNAFPAVRLEPESSFELSREWYIGGDLTQMMALRPLMREEYIMMKPKQPGRATVEVAMGRELPDVVTRVVDTNLPRAVIFRDSFSEDLIPFLQEHFQTAQISWARVGVDHRVIMSHKPDLVLQIMADRMLRKGQRYPIQIQRFACQQRFEASTQGMFALKEPCAVRQCSVRRGDDGWIITATGNAPRIELGGLDGDTSQLLPILRLDITMPELTDTRLVWRNARGEEQGIRNDLKPGRHILHIPLVDPDINGPLFFDPGHRKGDYILHAVDVRAVRR